MAERGRAATAIVLFTDVVGSTEQRTLLGDDQADAVRRAHDQVVRDAIAAHGGTAVKGTGDGVMAVFDAATEAIAAGVAMQRATRRFAASSGVEVAIRVGISAGDVSWEADDCFGTPVVEAARLCGAAGPEQVLVAEIVRLLAGSRGGHAFSSVGLLELKGLGEPVVAHEVTWRALATDEVQLPRALETSETIGFVGRAGATAALATAWKEALGGSRHAVLVSGEPGIGKTRLLTELARSVHADGATVLFGRCDEELGVPYQPFAEAVTSFLVQCPARDLHDHLGAYAGELARLAPELPSLVPGVDGPLRAEPETERYRLFEAFDLFLAASSAIAPVLLVLDDLHWAEPATLLLLRHLIRSSRPARVLVVATYRDTDLGRGHPLADALADLRREPCVERLDLHGLDAGEVAAFMETAAGHELDEAGTELAQRLHAETDGNPFFVGQVLRNLAEAGVLVHEGGRWVAADVSARLPEGVREVIGRRLSRLPDVTSDVLAVAAVVGRQFDTRLLVEVVDLDRDDVLDALEAAETAHLIEPVPEATGRHRFVHALVRSTLYEELPTTRRLRHHRRVGEALERRAEDEAILPDLARHFAEAASLGEEEKAARYGMLAARAAWRRLAYEDAARLCDQAIAAIDGGGPDADSARAELYVELQTAVAAAGDMDQTRVVTDRAVALARRLGRADVLARVALSRNGWRRVWADAGLVDVDLVALLEEAIATLPAEERELRARCLARLAAELYFDVASAERRDALVAEAAAIARADDDRETLAYVLATELWVRWRPGTAVERLAAARELDALAVELGAKEIQAANCAWLVGLHLEVMDRDELDSAVARFMQIADEIGQPLYQWWSRLGFGTLALLDGRFADAARVGEIAVTMGAQWQTSAMQMYGVQLIALRRALGGLEEMEPLTRAMVDQFPLIPSWRTGLCLVYAELGRVDEARAQLEVLAADDFACLPYDSNWLVGVALLALTAEAVGDRRRSELLHDMLLPHAESAVTAGAPADCLGSASAFLALAAAGCERWDDWDRHVADARRHHELLRSPALLARWALEEARVAARRGDAARTQAAVAECLRHAEPIGMTAVVERAQALRVDPQGSGTARA